MRAIFFDNLNLKIDETVIVTGEEAHHLFVVRAKAKESVLLLNGKGRTVETVIVESSKTQYVLRVQNVKDHVRSHGISLAIALPKKDAFEDILKMATELGIIKIYPLRSEFSQFEYSPHERYERLIKSGLVQSNNPFFPEIDDSFKDLTTFAKEHKNRICFFNSRPILNGKKEELPNEVTILIGPEAGFSETEEAMLLSSSNLTQLHFPTPILRAPTAASAAVGYLLNQ